MKRLSHIFWRAVLVAAIAYVTFAIVGIVRADNLWDSDSGFTKAQLPSCQSITVWESGVVTGGIAQE